MKTLRAIATVAALSVAGTSMATPAGPKVGVKPRAAGAQTPKGRSQTPKSDAPKSGAQKAHKAETKSRPKSATIAAAATPTAEPNAISTKISGKPEQLARVQTMLPEGMSLEQATSGFRNQGQFIAALNASKNQGVSFVDLQKAMTVDGLSLGQAVKKLKTITPPPTAPTGATQ